METKDVRAEFVGFGPIPSSKTTFAQGIGLGGSFAPVWTTEPQLPAKRAFSGLQQTTTYPFRLSNTSIVDGAGIVNRVLVQYGEIDGTPPTGMSLGDDYLLNPLAAAFIYLIVEFDGNGIIVSRAISHGEEVPDNTDSMKYIILGNVSYANGSYTVANQNISQDIYTGEAVVVNNSTNEFVYSLFADPRKIHIINALEIFGVDVNGGASISKLYLENESNSEYIELKKDTEVGEVSVNGFAGSNAQNFILSSNDTDATSELVLFDTDSANYLESKVDTDAETTSVYGYAGSNAQNFVLSSDNTASISKLELFDASSANFFTSAIDSTSKVSVRGYSNNEEQQFLLECNSVTGSSQLSLFDSGSTNYLNAKIDTENNVTSIEGYTDNRQEAFIISSDSENGKSTVEIVSGTTTHTLVGKVDATNEQTSFKGIQNNATSFELIATETNSKITLDDGDSHLVEIDIPTAGASKVSASWKEIDVCVDGVAKKMQVLGTEPYDPPTP
jgi:hypothetical protein